MNQVHQLTVLFQLSEQLDTPALSHTHLNDFGIHITVSSNPRRRRSATR
ncbi:hypothetical protein OH492_14295 [Vibrio chagasii]|nr:hypothetical protein [Vibrio chagasii]